MIGKNSMKHHYLKKKIFIATLIWKILLMYIIRTQKDFEDNCKDFEIKNLGEYHDLYVHSSTLLLAEILLCVLKYRNLILQNFLQLPD